MGTGAYRQYIYIYTHIGNFVLLAPNVHLSIGNINIAAGRYTFLVHYVIVKS